MNCTCFPQVAERNRDCICRFGGPQRRLLGHFRYLGAEAFVWQGHEVRDKWLVHQLLPHHDVCGQYAVFYSMHVGDGTWAGFFGRRIMDLAGAAVSEGCQVPSAERFDLLHLHGHVQAWRGTDEAGRQPSPKAAKTEEQC